MKKLKFNTIESIISDARKGKMYILVDDENRENEGDLIFSTKDLDEQDVCELIFGDEIGHNNKISYQMQGTINKEYMKIKYNSNMMKTILNANKDMSEGKFKISNAGLMYLHFTDGVIESEYYMVPTEDGIIS